MRVPIFHVDAFASCLFSGNPAAVMVLPTFYEDSKLQRIAAENNLAETAFIVRRDDGSWNIRWFTPTVEVPLCGHATLASAWVVTQRIDIGAHEVVFHSASGVLPVRRTQEHFIMNFPARTVKAVALPNGLEAALGTNVLETFHDGFNYIALLESADAVRLLQPDVAKIQNLADVVGVIVTASGNADFDCVSRYFAPQKGIPEDPVTGGAHCALTPLWGARLGKNAIRAYQASLRGGELLCTLRGDRVELQGRCVPYLEGHAEV